MFSIAYLILTYFIGAIPFGLILARLMNLPDLRTIGSANIGTTNAFRTGNKFLGIATFVCDSLKGTLMVYFCPQTTLLTIPLFLIAGLVVILGHIFPVYLKFKGGKGVATTAGVLLAVNPLVFALGILLWGIVFLMTKTSSLAGLITTFSIPIIFFLLGDYKLTVFTVLLTVLILWTHRTNVIRLLNKNELKL